MDQEQLPLSARVGGRPANAELHDGVPDWLLRPLLDWLKSELRPWSVRQIALRLRIGLADEDPAALCDDLMSRADTAHGRWDLLDAIACLITLDSDDLKIPSQWVGRTPVPRSSPLSRLNYILEQGGSAYRVGHVRLGLERRIDETVTAAIDQAVTVASGITGEHLQRAWDETYGLHPNPTTAYREAVRAVEAIACPLVLPNSSAPTLGTVLAHLRAAPHKWTVTVPGRDKTGSDTGVATLIAMLELLWTGQISRHAGASGSRDQLQIEAEAVLPLAATAVQWFAIGAVRRVAVV